MRLDVAETGDLAGPRRKRIGPEPGAFIESLVCAAFGVRQSALHDPRRGAERVALARQIAMYLAHTRLGLTYAASGALFGRDRTTRRTPSAGSRSGGRI